MDINILNLEALSKIANWFKIIEINFPNIRPANKLRKV
jgi:hypothetical protein